MNNRTHLARYILSRYLYGQAADVSEEDTKQKKGPPPRWNEWLNTIHGGGKKKIPNPNPKTRANHPDVAFSTALKDKGFFQKALKDYREWAKKNPPRDDAKPKESGKPETEKPAKPKKPESTEPKPAKPEKPKETPKPAKPKPAKPKPPEKPTEPPEEPKSGKTLDVELPPERYKKTKILLGRGKRGEKRLLKKLGEKIPSIHSTKDLADLAGAGVVGASSVQCFSGDNPPPIELSVKSDHALWQTRRIDVDGEGKVYIYNDTLNLKPTAPKGLGTKILASQIASAMKMGAKYLSCEAYRDTERPEWVGYKVWPKMGYDGEVPETVSNKLPPKLTKAMKGAGAEKPWKVSDLYRTPGGQDWWEENGESFKAKFDLSEDSHSMMVFQAYLEKVAKRTGTSTKDLLRQASLARQIVARFLELTAKKKPEEDRHKGPPKKDRHENLQLHRDEDKDLDSVWDELRKRQQKKTGGFLAH